MNICWQQRVARWWKARELEQRAGQSISIRPAEGAEDTGMSLGELRASIAGEGTLLPIELRLCCSYQRAVTRMAAPPICGSTPNAD